MPPRASAWAVASRSGALIFDCEDGAPGRRGFDEVVPSMDSLSAPMLL
jgi:hypothetical protein